MLQNRDNKGLTKATQDRDPEVSKAAKIALCQINVESLISSKPGTDLISGIKLSLVKFGTFAVEPLLVALKEKPTNISVIDTLGEIRDNRALIPLVQLLDPATNNKVRMATIAALGNIGDTRAVKPLILEFLSTNDELWRAAGRALMQIDPSWSSSQAARDTIPSILEALQSNDKRRAAEQLLSLLDPEWYSSQATKKVIPPLIKNLRSTDSNERKAICELLSKIDPKWRDSQVAEDAFQLFIHGENFEVLSEINSNWRELDVTKKLIRDLIVTIPTKIEESQRNALKSKLSRIYPNWQRSEVAKDAIPSLLEKLNFPGHASVPHNALNVLSEISGWERSQSAKEVIPSLIKNLHSKGPASNVSAQAIQHIIPNYKREELSEDVISKLLTALLSNSNKTQEIIKQVLTQIEPNWQNSNIAQVIQAIQRREWGVVESSGPSAIAPLVIFLNNSRMTRYELGSSLGTVKEQEKTKEWKQGAELLVRILGYSIDHLSKDDLETLVQFDDLTRTETRTRRNTLADDDEQYEVTVTDFDCEKIRQIARQELDRRH